MKYRPEVDGLRTVAVLPVIAYHLGSSIAGGGYVGVDVFFVISGFLITRLLAGEVEAGTFTFAGFYARRARRLLPALFAVLTVSYALGALLLLPDEFVQLAQSALSTILFASNVHFWQGTDYFAAPSELKPLLHTWSLAVEEQFYMVFPFIVIGLVRHLRRWSAHAVFAALVLCLTVASYAVFKRPAAAFYLIPFRAWELLLGAALGLGLVPDVTSAKLRAALTWLGLALILVPVFAYSPATPFPGAAALPPTLGAALALHCCRGERRLPHILFSNRLCVETGRLSYSLYLWHWPLIVFYKYWNIVPLGNWDRTALAGLTILCAWLCYRFVEAPLRHVRMGAAPLLSWSAAAMLAVAVPAASILLGGGFAGRYSPEAQQLVAAADGYSPRRQDCHTDQPPRGGPAKILVHGGLGRG